MARKPGVTRDAILDAAQRITAERGANRLTLDVVAEESGLSKGGLLYHFPSKEALIQGMLERLVALTNAARENEADTLGDGPHRTLRALIAIRNRSELFDPNVLTAILAAAATHPALLDPVREHIAKVREQIIAESGNQPLFWLLWAAADGLLLQETLGISPYPPEDAQRVRQQLQLLAEELLPCTR